MILHLVSFFSCRDGVDIGEKVLWGDTLKPLLILGRYLKLVKKMITLIKNIKMGEIARSSRQITIFFNPESIIAEKTLAFAKAEGLPILEIDVLKNPPTGTQLGELSDRLNLKIKDLVNQESDFFKSLPVSQEFSSNDWIKMIRNNPEILKLIALKGAKTIIVNIPTDILKL